MNRAEVSSIASSVRSVCERLGNMGYDGPVCCKDVGELLRCVVLLANLVERLADEVASGDDQ